MTETGKALEILIVEDNPEFLGVAKAYFTTQEGINATYSTNYEEGLHHIRNGRYDGALIDCFMPAEDSIGRKVYEIIKEKGSISYRGTEGFNISLSTILESLSTEAPVGLLLREEAINRNIPNVIVTSMGHHARKFEAVFQYLQPREGECKSKKEFAARFKSGFQEGLEGQNLFHDRPDFDEVFKKRHPEGDKNNPEYWKKAVSCLKELFDLRIENYPGPFEEYSKLP